MSQSDPPIYVVTGASAGIGRAVAARLARRGFGVHAVARSMGPMEALATAYPAHLTAVSADLSESAGIEKVVASIGHHERIAGIIHAAGSLVPLEPLDHLDAEELVDHFRIHVGAPIALRRAISKHHSIDRMLYIDSYSASNARVGWAGYSIVKAAAQMSAQCAAQELTETLTVRVFPGAVKTRIVDAVLASQTETAKTFAAMLSRGECVEPDQAAMFIVSLVADASDELLRTREAWDYNNADDRSAVLSLR